MTMRSVEVGGTVVPGFERVRDAFARNFEEHGEVGAGYALYVEGEKVVDLWGGVADRATGAPYTEDSLQLVFSTTKGATAACANLLAQRGELDVDAPVAEYWPEFAQAGKGAIPVRWLLCHKAGVPTVDAELTAAEVFAWDPVIHALEVQEPFWEPGTAHGYHAITYGYLVGEVVRRISGKSLGTFWQHEIARPLDLEFWIGLPAEQEHRVAKLVGMRGNTEAGDGDESAESTDLTSLLGPDSLVARALSLNGAFGDLADGFNSPELHAAEMPAANGITNARSLARFYAALVGGVEHGPSEPLLTPEQVDAARTCQTEGADAVLSFPGIELPTTIGLGFWTSSAFAPYGGERSFGHSGAGGSVGFADPEARLAGGYVMNRMMQGLAGDPRSRGLIQASYECAGAPAVFV
jgi:CubicO group peptidase (beta-lactamase class C family)